MDGLGFLVVVALAAIGAAVAWWLKQKRKKEVQAYAAQHGLHYAHHDVRGVSSLPFKHWRLGDRCGWENLLYGDKGGKAVAVFDFWYEVESRDSDGNRQTTTYRHTCAVAPMAGAFTPGLLVEPETLWSRMKDRAGFRDIEVESDDFNRRYEVKALDERFALAFLDARMIQWLLGAPRGHAFEVIGDHVLVVAPTTSPSSWLTLHHMAWAFAERRPNVVTQWWPA